MLAWGSSDALTHQARRPSVLAAFLQRYDDPEEEIG
jgi:hypothetical protein